MSDLSTTTADQGPLATLMRFYTERNRIETGHHDNIRAVEYPDRFQIDVIGDDGNHHVVTVFRDALGEWNWGGLISHALHRMKRARHEQAVERICGPFTLT